LSLSLTTMSAWFELKKPIIDAYAQRFWPRWLPDFEVQDRKRTPEPSLATALHAVQHALRKVFPEVVICDPQEVSGLCLFEPGLPPRIYVYDSFPEGLGLAEQMYDEPTPFLVRALDLIEHCNCLEDQGCPVCLSLYQCPQFNAELSKLGARFILRSLLAEGVEGVLSDLQSYAAVHFPPSAVLASPPALPSRQAGSASPRER
jgi:DEAD/DEAH box helicase domain-containing protein